MVRVTFKDKSQIEYPEAKATFTSPDGMLAITGENENGLVELIAMVPSETIERVEGVNPPKNKLELTEPPFEMATAGNFDEQ